MDEDIEAGREAIKELLSGIAQLAHGLTDADGELSEDERQLRHDAVKGVEQLLRGVTDLGALAVAAQRASSEE